MVGIAGSRCCASAARGHVAAVPASNVMKSRRRMCPLERARCRCTKPSTLRGAARGKGQLIDPKSCDRMSETGYKLTSAAVWSWSAHIPEIGHLGVRHACQQRANSRSGPLYSMISSALSRTEVGSVKLSARAVLRFATSLKRTGRSTGNSAGAAPCRTLRVRAPACMNRLWSSGP